MHDRFGLNREFPTRKKAAAVLLNAVRWDPRRRRRTSAKEQTGYPRRGMIGCPWLNAVTQWGTRRRPDRHTRFQVLRRRIGEH
jgi:hypothetical protein